VSNLDAAGSAAAAAIAIGVGVAAGFAAWRQERAARAVELGAVNRAHEEQDALLQDIREVKGVPELAELVAFNERQIRVYQELSTFQAKSSYRRSQMAFGAGFLLIVAAIAASVAGSDTATKVAAVGVGGLGGICSAYISATYLRVYERALDQLNFYYRQPLVNSYLLSAERLANGMSRAKRDAAYDELLHQVLACARTPDQALGTAGSDNAGQPVRLKRKMRPERRH
jgi:hypothetical protein